MTWSTGTFDIMAEPGGVTNCVLTCCCSCIPIGDINEAIDGPGGKMGGIVGEIVLTGCLGLHFACPMYQGLQVSKKAGFEESIVNALLCSCCCTPCYTCQQWREVKIKKIGEPGYSGQQ
mmetsp:Transcript_70999/g.179111  ORF Transcript_70999/g.179111 Transcript_70999/m.179111 type:complete len:119 (-) Transcript_70999:205-561(-)